VGIPAALGIGASGLPNLGDQANQVVSGTFTAVGPGRAMAFRGAVNMAIWASYTSSLATTNGSSSATIGTAGAVAKGEAISSVNLPPGTTVGAITGATITLAFPTITLYGTASISARQITGLPSTAGLLGATVTVPSNKEQVTLPAGTTVVAIIKAAISPTNINPGVPGIVAISNLPTAAPALMAPVPFDFALTNSAVTTGTDAAAVFTGADIIYVGNVNVERSFDGANTWLVANIGGAGTPAQYAAGTPVNITFGDPEAGVLYRMNCTSYASGTINYRMSATGAAATTLAVGTVL
jgi:hypothetical protein